MYGCRYVRVGTPVSLVRVGKSTPYLIQICKWFLRLGCESGTRTPCSDGRSARSGRVRARDTHARTHCTVGRRAGERERDPDIFRRSSHEQCFERE